MSHWLPQPSERVSVASPRVWRQGRHAAPALSVATTVAALFAIAFHGGGSSSSSTTGSCCSTAVVASPEVSYMVERSWVTKVQPRMLELEPPASVGRENDMVRRLLVPRRQEDAHFLRMLELDQIRVDLLPHRSPSPHVHVRVYTSAITVQRLTHHRLAKWFGPDKGWLLFLQAVVDLPPGTHLSCIPEWHWATNPAHGLNGSELRAPSLGGEATGLPFRILEVSCPPRFRGSALMILRNWLLPGYHRSSMGNRPTKESVAGCVLIVVCLVQIVLLLLCIMILLVQLCTQGPRAGMA